MELVKREGQDVMIVIDVSNSMLAEDMRPNRLERAKQEVRGLLDRLKGDRIGIVAFAGAAYIQCPLTLDYSAARLFLDIIDVDLIPQPGTNLLLANRLMSSEGNQNIKLLDLATDAIENRLENVPNGP